jgi:hypothetical protein
VTRLAAAAFAAIAIFALGIVAGRASSHPASITTISTTTTSPPSSSSNVPPWIAADCSIDVTRTLSTWIASMPDGSTLSFGSGCYRIEGTLELTDRSRLVLKGGVFRSLTPPTDERAIWRVVNSSGIVFRNMLIQGSFTQASSPHIVEGLQHAHGIDLRGSSAEVDHVIASNLAGDCVYFGLGIAKSSGSYHDSTCSNVSRNAASVTAGRNISIFNVVTSGIGFIPFDIEPNAGAGYGASNITIRNNTIGSFYLYAFGVLGDNAVNGVSFLRNHVNYAGKGGQLGIGVNTTTGQRYSNVTISGTVTSVTQAGNAIDAQRTDGLVVTDNIIPVKGIMLLCSNVTSLTFSGNDPATKSGCP